MGCSQSAARREEGWYEKSRGLVCKLPPDSPDCMTQVWVPHSVRWDGPLERRSALALTADFALAACENQSSLACSLRDATLSMAKANCTYGSPLHKSGHVTHDLVWGPTAQLHGRHVPEEKGWDFVLDDWVSRLGNEQVISQVDLETQMGL